MKWLLPVINNQAIKWLGKSEFFFWITNQYERALHTNKSAFNTINVVDYLDLYGALINKTQHKKYICETSGISFTFLSLSLSLTHSFGHTSLYTLTNNIGIKVYTQRNDCEIRGCLWCNKLVALKLR